MLDLALKMLLGDRAKYVMLISGLTFASLLMTEQAAIFCGIMQWSGSTLDNVGAPIWVVDPMVEQINDTEAMRDTDVSRVRSVEGVAWASPLYQGMLRTRRPAPAEHGDPRRIRRQETQPRSGQTHRPGRSLRDQ
jgi:putative ABC transport system permease protein